MLLRIQHRTKKILKKNHKKKYKTFFRKKTITMESYCQNNFCAFKKQETLAYTLPNFTFCDFYYFLPERNYIFKSLEQGARRFCVS